LVFEKAFLDRHAHEEWARDDDCNIQVNQQLVSCSVVFPKENFSHGHYERSEAIQKHQYLWAFQRFGVALDPSLTFSDDTPSVRLYNRFRERKHDCTTPLKYS
jgi:hypothetical protein